MGVYIAVVPIVSIIALWFVWWLVKDVLGRDTGTPEMQEVAQTIFEGATAFLKRQYTTIGILAVVTAAIITLAIGLFEKYPEVQSYQSRPMALGLLTGIAFLVGAVASAASGIIGMYVAVRSNGRVASAARGGVGPALEVALRGGAVSGFLVVTLSLIGVYVMFLAYGGLSHPEDAPFLIVGTGFGASFVALFAQLGGGIYTKAADVGADLVGKVEANVPEDDPRNAGVIADLVGDNVGDCAGRGADLFESTVAENIGAMILGVALWRTTHNTNFIFFPLVVRSFGLLASIVGVLMVSPPDILKRPKQAVLVETDPTPAPVASGEGFETPPMQPVTFNQTAPATQASKVPDFVYDLVDYVRYRDGEEPMNSLFRGYAVAAVLSIVGMFLCTLVMLGGAWFPLFLSGVVGIVAAIAFVMITMYYTEHRFRPVKEIAEASKTGVATNIISGIAVGYENTAAPVIAISIALLASFSLGTRTADVLQVSSHAAGIFGTAVATMGMLMTAAFVLAMDTFGPIVDNAGGIVEMSNAPKEVRDGTDALDAAGNTTKALTKGYAIGSAALAAFLLFSAYLDKVTLIQIAKGLTPISSVDLGKVPVFVGALIGAMLVFLFSAFAIRAVSNVAQEIIKEVRRQFKEIPGLLEGVPGVKADYARCVDITTRGALRAMVLPGALAIVVPILVGWLLKAEAAAALLMVGTMTGILLATVMNNAGGAWYNAKKYIETGAYGGKGSEAHKAAVVGDTIGDPFKDTAGPSLHVLIKLLATITLVLAPLFV
ncbi:MAG: sodium/proton-translocating pyrophosphatase [Chloroflexi bacterium]|nr:sodium/proton-translocating pyrophosphatase [Chloroflexota bacterium]